MIWRYCYFHFFIDNRFYRRLYFVRGLDYISTYIQSIFGRRRIRDIKLYFGSALYSITPAFAKYILSLEKKIYKRFKYTACSDETFLQSIIMNSLFKDRVAPQELGNLRLIDFSRPRNNPSSPYTWKVEDLAYILSQPKSICFARKFDEKVDFEIVKAIEARILM